MTLRQASFLFLCFHLLGPMLYKASDAALSSSVLQALNCSTSGNYTATSAYAANVNQFLGALPENALSRNGGFYNGTAGLGPDTVYGLAMCPADYSRSDCGDCLAGAAASNAGGLPNHCPGSTTVLAMFDRCLIRYSNVNFFGTPEIGAVYTSAGERVSGSTKVYTDKLVYSLSEATSAANMSPQRFASSVGTPYVSVQCTWDLPADKCKQCLDVLSANATDFWILRTEGQQKSYSCTVRYSNSSFMVVPFTGVSGQQSVDKTGTSSNSTGARAVRVVGPIVAVVVLVCLVASIWCVRKIRGKPHKTEDIEQVVTNTGVIVHDGRFSYKQLEHATSNFAEVDRLGQGAFGAVYKGKLQVEGIERHVAIKKIIDATSTQSKADFANEYRIMRRVNHRNIVNILGLCDEIDNLFLVYELMENGNLEDHLYPSDGATDLHLFTGADPAATPLLLDWHKRHNILVGIASGLVYLHSECKERLLHRDIKPSNVMLDKNFNAKLCDFGLVKQFGRNKTSQTTENIRGTKVYIDPAYKDTGKACEQNDVYSFGILLLEVVCCEKPILTQTPAGDWNNLVEKVRISHYQKNSILDAADKRLRGQFDEQLKRVLMIGLLCVQPDRHLRPHIRRVFECLTNKTVSLPYLPDASRALPTVNESGSVASTSYNPSSSSTVPSAHSRAAEDAGTAPFISGK